VTRFSSPALRRALLSAALGALTAAPACAQAPRSPGASTPFAYDAAAPLELRDSLVRTQDGIEVRRISYASPRGGRATGYVLVPPGKGPFAGVVQMHGAPGDAAQSVERGGLSAAAHGAVVIAIDAPWARRGAPPLAFDAAVDSADQVQLIVDLQRAVDVLLARRDVDPARLAYVGGSYGGAQGALFAGIERRLKTYVLFVPDGGFVSHFTGPDDAQGPLSEMPAAQRERWLAAMNPIEPIRWIGRATAPILFQSGRQDPLVPASDAAAIHAAYHGPKEVKWYDSGHGLPAQARLDRLEWLAKHVGTTPPHGRRARRGRAAGSGARSGADALTEDPSEDQKAGSRGGPAFSRQDASARIRAGKCA
jgi:cephalosporin-C deacetylase-like acetyl esterase